MEPTDRVDPRARRGGDPLAVMYVLAALLMAIAATAVVVLMFVPSDLFDDRGSGEVWVPGSLPGWTMPGDDGPQRAPGVYEIAPDRYLVVMEAYNWAFEPDEVRVPAGAEVTFQGRSTQDYHGIAILGTPVVVSFDRSSPTEITHTFTEPGEYPWVCSEYCGAGHLSMTGRVVVE